MFGPATRTHPMTDASTNERARAASQKRRIGAVLGLNIALIAGLVIVGITAHSLGVLAAGGDFIADSAALALGLVAITVREKVGAHSNATTVVAGVNATVLAAVTVFVAIAAIRRLTGATPHVVGLPVVIVSVIAAIAMVVGALILGRSAGGEDLHMRSVLLDTISDAVAAGAVAIGGAVILIAGGLYWIDSVLALAISAIIGFAALQLIKDVIVALRHGGPL